MQKITGAKPVRDAGFAPQSIWSDALLWYGNQLGALHFAKRTSLIGHLTCRTWEVHSEWGLQFLGEWLSGNSRPHRSTIYEPWRCTPFREANVNFGHLIWRAWEAQSSLAHQF